MGVVGKYILINDLKSDHLTAVLYLDLKDKKLCFKNGDMPLLLHQNYDVDTTSYFYIKHLEYKGNDVEYHFETHRLIDFDEQYIYVSAILFQIDSNGKKTEINKFKNIAISKDNVNGIVIGRTIRQERRFYTFIGVLSAIILGLTIIAGE
jgi:hypothetical protein